MPSLAASIPSSKYGGLAWSERRRRRSSRSCGRRSKLGMIREGEILYRLVPEPEPDPEETEATETEDPG
jgi:hypothetical protein